MSIKINIWEKESNKDYKSLYKNFGRWQDISSEYKSDRGLLDRIFKARAAKTVGGCRYCDTPYKRFNPIKNTKGFRCKCQKTKVYPLKGTHLENYKKPLSIVSRVLYDMMINKNGISSLLLVREFNIDEKSANLLTRRLSDWMHWALMNRKFTPYSTIEIDEVYPKFNAGLGDNYKLKRGKGSERTHGILVMCERDGLSLAIPYDKKKRGEVSRLIKQYIPAENKNIIYTDESTEYLNLEKDGYRHYTVNHKKREYAVDDRCTNLSENLNSFIKNNLEYTHKGVYADYLSLYVSRYAYVHCIRDKIFEECLDELISSLPNLNEKVSINYKRKKIKNEFYSNAA